MCPKNLGNTRCIWHTVKGFMEWKVAGSPSQIQSGNVLYSKAADVAMIMNKFFMNKVETLRKKFQGNISNLQHCEKIMMNRQCRLGLRYVPLSAVRKYLRKLKPSKSLAVDELDSYSIKMLQMKLLLLFII